MKFDIHKLAEFSPEQKEKFLKVMDYGLHTINSDQFKEKILSYSYETSYWSWFRRKYKTNNSFYQNNGKSNQQIYDMFMSGTDDINPLADLDMDLYLHLYYVNSNTIGYTNQDTQEIFINTKYFNDNLNSLAGNCAIIGNIVHEYMHKIGFDHDYFSTGLRPYSVPYAIGDIAETVTRDIMRAKL